MTKDFTYDRKRCPCGTQFPEIDSRKSPRHTVYDKTTWPRPSAILLASGYRTYSNFEPCTHENHKMYVSKRTYYIIMLLHTYIQ